MTDQQSYLDFLQDKPLWFILTVLFAVGIGVLTYYIAPKVFDKKSCEERIKELKLIIQKGEDEKLKMKEDILQLKMQNLKFLKNYSTFTGAYNALRHANPELPSLKDLKRDED